MVATNSMSSEQSSGAARSRNPSRHTLANERCKRRGPHTGSSCRYFGEPEPVDDGVLAAAFNALSGRDRKVLRLVAWEALSLADAATVCVLVGGWIVGAVECLS